jgi:hypothetical protein
MRRIVVLCELGLAITTNVKAFAVNATKARTCQATCVTNAALGEGMKHSAASHTNLFRGDLRERPLLYACRIWLRRGPIEGCPAPWLLVATMVRSTANHGIATIDLGDWPLAFRTLPAICSFPRLV